MTSLDHTRSITEENRTSQQTQHQQEEIESYFQNVSRHLRKVARHQETPAIDASTEKMNHTLNL